MKVLIIGGIFGGTEEFRRTKMQETTETVLAEGLRARGVDVVTAPHERWNEMSGIDLVHLHHLASGCPQFLLRRRVPLVFTRHATKALPFAHEVLWRLLRQRADALIALSERERMDLGALVGPTKVSRIYNGVRPDGFNLTSRTYVKGDGPLELLYVGQLVELKRVHLAIELLSRLRGNGHDARLTVISHKEVLREDLENLAGSLGVSSFVKWVSGATREGVADAMHGAHVLVHPSRTEALSTVAIEACFTGLPVLAFNVGGMAEQLPDSWPLYEPEEISRWSDFGLELADSYADAESLFLAHAATARRTFSIPDMVDAHISLYQEVLDRAR